MVEQTLRVSPELGQLLGSSPRWEPQLEPGNGDAVFRGAGWIVRVEVVLGWRGLRCEEV